MNYLLRGILIGLLCLWWGALTGLASIVKKKQNVFGFGSSI